MKRGFLLSFFILVFLSTKILADITTGLVAHYEFENNGDDSSINAYHGTVTNITYVDGKIGNAASFDGSSSYIDVISVNNDLPSNIPSSSSVRTVSFWAKPTSAAPATQGNFISWGSNTTNSRFSIMQRTSGTLDFIGAGNDHSSGYSMNNSWQHIVVTYDGGTTMNVYIDGQLENSLTITALTTDATQRLRIGITIEGFQDEFYTGLLDDVRIYNRILSAADVDELYKYTPIKSLNLIGFGVRELSNKFQYTYTGGNTFYSADLTEEGGVCLSGRNGSAHYTSYVDGNGSLVWNDSSHGGDAHSVATDGTACYSIGWGGPFNKYQDSNISLSSLNTSGYHLDTDPDGNSYILINGGGVKRVNSNMTTTDWSFAAHTHLGLNDATSSHVVYNSGHVYIVGVDWDTRQNGFVFKLDATTGNVIWNGSFSATANAQDGRIAVTDNKIIVPAGNNNTHIFDKNDGTLIQSTGSYLSNIVGIGDTIIARDTTVKILDESLNVLSDLGVSEYPEEIRPSGLISKIDTSNIRVYEITKYGTSIYGLETAHNYEFLVDGSKDITVSITSSDSSIVSVGSYTTAFTAAQYENTPISFSLTGHQTGNTTVTVTITSGAEIITKTIDVSVVLVPKLSMKAHGGVVEFDGVSKINTTLTSLTETFTIETWINTNYHGETGTSYQHRPIATKQPTNGTNQEVEINFKILNWKYPSFFMGYDNTGFTQITSTTPITQDQWVHLAVTYNGTDRSMKLYMDGVEVGSDTLAGTTRNTTTNPITIAHYLLDGSTDQYFDGRMDEIRVWSVARTQSEISENMHIQLEGTESGLVAYYNFDERAGNSVLDITSNSNDSVIEGNAIRLNFLGDALEFNGVDNFIEVADNNSLDLSNAITMTAWVKPTLNANGTIFSKYYNSDGSVAYGYELLLGSDGLLQFSLDGITNADAVSHITHTTPLKADQYTHVAVTYDGSFMKIYLNGVLDNSLTASGTITSSLAPLLIGKRYISADTRYFSGEIAESSLWSKALSIEEIEKVMHSSFIGNETDLVGYWKLNEGGGTAAYDMTANNLDGTITGTTWIDTAPKILGEKIYTTSGYSSFHKLVVENATGTPTYSYNGNVPTSISNFNGSGGTFFYTGTFNESLNFNGSDNGTALSTLINTVVRSSNNMENLNFNIKNLNFEEKNITNIYYLGRNGNSETFPIAGSENLIDGDNNITIYVSNINQDFSLLFDVNNSDHNASYLFNFDENKLYFYNSSYDSNSSFIATAINGANFSFDPSLSTNWITNNNSPTILTSSLEFYITDGTPATTEIGIISASDMDNDPITFSLSGTDASYLNIDETTGSITILEAVDMNNKSIYSFNVHASDNNGGEDVQSATLYVSTTKDVSLNISFPTDLSQEVSMRFFIIDANRSSGTIERISKTFTKSGSAVVSVPTYISYFYLGYETNSTEYIQAGYYNTNSSVFSLNEATPIDLQGVLANDSISLTLDSGITVTGAISGYTGEIVKGGVYPLRVDGKDLLNYGAEINASDEYMLRVPYGNYKLKFFIEDNNGIHREFYTSSGGTVNSSDGEILTISTSTTANLTMASSAYTPNILSFTTGWNLLSIPAKAIYDKSDLYMMFEDLNVSHLVKYNGIVGWSYFWVDHSIANAEVNRFSELNSKEGFWLKANSSGTIDIPTTGQELSYSNELANISTGWNLIGFPYTKTVLDIVNTIESSGVTVESLWLYRGGSWVVHFPYSTEYISTITDSEEISASEGIWINLQ